MECVGKVAFPALALGIAQRQEVPIPRTYQEAIQDPKWGHMWEEAIQKELIALGSNYTWEQVVPPRGANLVTSKWVFDVKRLISGAIDKFKARLVARGFSQKFGVDFQETFAPTVRHDTLRVFMAAGLGNCTWRRLVGPAFSLPHVRTKTVIPRRRSLVFPPTTPLYTIL